METLNRASSSLNCCQFGTQGCTRLQFHIGKPAEKNKPLTSYQTVENKAWIVVILFYVRDMIYHCVVYRSYNNLCALLDCEFNGRYIGAYIGNSDPFLFKP